MVLLPLSQCSEGEGEGEWRGEFLEKICAAF